MSSAKFRIANDNRKSKTQSDNVGIVVVKVFLADVGHKAKKGNVVRTIRLEKCRVTEVFDAITESIVYNNATGDK